MAYFIYAIRPPFMAAVKIGHSVADIPHLRSRYSTAYGNDLIIGVFQVENKKKACQVETAVHKVLIAAGHHLSNEIFKLECMPLFETTAAALCQNAVSNTQTLASGAAKKEAVASRKAARAFRKDQRHMQRQDAEVAKQRAKKDKELWVLAKAIHKRKHEEHRRQTALTEFIDKHCVLQPAAHCNASLFRQSLLRVEGAAFKQVQLKELMRCRGVKYLTKTGSYKGIAIL